MKEKGKYMMKKITALILSLMMALWTAAPVFAEGVGLTSVPANPTLPNAGGMGTTIFYVIGGGMVLIAVVLLVTKKRMDK